MGAVTISIYFLLRDCLPGEEALGAGRVARGGGAFMRADSREEAGSWGWQQAHSIGCCSGHVGL